MKAFMKTVLAVIAAVSVVSATTAASAQDVPPPSSGGAGWLTQGAEILPMGKYALDARVGFPSTDIGVHIPVMSAFEITPFLGLDYLAYGRWNGGFGNTFGVQLKGKLWSQGAHAISLGGDVGIITSYVGNINGLDVGLQIGGPELKYSYRFNNPRIAIIAGFRMPIRVWFLNGGGAEIPFLWDVGFEYNVIPNLNIHANLEFGGVGLAGTSATWNWGNAWGNNGNVIGHVGFQFGISYLF